MQHMTCAKDTQTRKAKQVETSWPRKVQPGREVVNVYRRLTPSGNFAFMVANYAEGKRRFDAYSSEANVLPTPATAASAQA